MHTNPPPYRYGSPTPKAAESILRAHSFNKKADKNKKHVINLPVQDMQIERTHWEEDGPYPFFDVTGNWHPGEMYRMSQSFLKKFHQETDGSAEEIMNVMMNTNSDILTKGRQTFDPINEKSTTASRAYRKYMI
jgi:hypothetical protein